MREILFRGKPLGNLHGKFIYGSLGVIDTDLCAIYHCFEFKDDEMQLVDPETVGQYSGIIDDNGKKIFEGDILGITNDDPDYDYITKVYLDCNTLCVDVQGQDYDCTSIGFAIGIWDDECDRVEVIGNIHDNPELLEA